MLERRRRARASMGLSRWARRSRRLELPGRPNPSSAEECAAKEEVKGQEPIRCPICGRLDEDERNAEEHYHAAHETFSG